jgi:hypothetical protein
VLRQYLAQGDQVDVAVQPEGGDQYYVTGLEPYFDTQPIHNDPFRFWYWGGNNFSRAMYLKDSQARSVVVVVEETGEDWTHPGEETRLASLGYHRDKVVCGQA